MSKLKVAFIHPDLGIGGAERLVVDAAVGLQSKGHDVVFYTSHHDPNHCFEETRDGTLPVRVRGNQLPRTVFGRFYILCAILRQLVLAFSILYYDRDTYDVIIIDQLSACIPLFKLFSSARILFYCHFPDKLLSSRGSALKALYRKPVDMLEEWTTGMADEIAVNSGFTAGVFRESFPSILKTPHVLYPPINFKAYDRDVDMNDPSVKILESTKKTLLSINRFERKKNVELALRAFATLKKTSAQQVVSEHRLVLAGGYDRRVQENVEYLKELDKLAQDEYGLKTFTIHPSKPERPPEDTEVVFVCSFNDAQRTYLLRHATLLLYTPSNEHFGITPVEGMYACVPVMAVNSGGPVESVVHGRTGLLLPSDAQVWAEGIRDLIMNGKYDAKRMGQQGRKHVEAKFGLSQFTDQLEGLMDEMVTRPPVSNQPIQYMVWVILAMTAAGIAWIWSLREIN